jgi:anti-anti-sigma factor
MGLLGMQADPDGLAPRAGDRRRTKSLFMARRVERSARQMHVHVAGELDAHSAEDLGRELATCLTLPGIKSVIVDLSELRFIAAAGIHALLVVSRLAKTEGRNFAAIRPPAPLQRVFRLAGAERELVWLDVAEPCACASH